MLWIVCAVAVVVAGGFVLAPLYRERAPDLDLAGETEADHLLEQKAACYRNLKDLEFEYRMGRLAAADYEGLRAEHKAEAAGILAELDRLDASDGAGAAVEREIAARRAALFGPGAGTGAGTGAKKGRDGSRCPACGAAAAPGKKFCADCGKRL